MRVTPGLVIVCLGLALFGRQLGELATTLASGALVLGAAGFGLFLIVSAPFRGRF